MLRRRTRCAVLGTALLALALVPGGAVPDASTEEPETRMRSSGTAARESSDSPYAIEIVDAETGRPLPGAIAAAGGVDLSADSAGRIQVPRSVAVNGVIVRVPGYERRRLTSAEAVPRVALAPQRVRAAYLTYYGVAEPSIRERVLALVIAGRLNAVVIDVKSDDGFIPYESGSPLAEAIGASRGPIRMRDFDALLARLRERGVYLIARIVVFKDTVLARRKPEWAVHDRRTGAPWRDREGQMWIDPRRSEAWAHGIALAREAARKGFDEIQLDYLRFPTNGHLNALEPTTAAQRVDALGAYLTAMRSGLAGTGAFLAVDTFGYTAFNADDTGIGQRIEDLAPLVDYLCPMAYPSAYHRGIPGHPDPVRHPFEVVFQTVQRTRRRAALHPVRVRPWIQDFRDYAFDRRPFGVAEVRAQTRAAEEAGAAGWMLWNPRNEYTADALAPPG